MPQQRNRPTYAPTKKRNNPTNASTKKETHKYYNKNIDKIQVVFMAHFNNTLITPLLDLKFEHKNVCISFG